MKSIKMNNFMSIGLIGLCITLAIFTGLGLLGVDIKNLWAYLPVWIVFLVIGIGQHLAKRNDKLERNAERN